MSKTADSHGSKRGRPDSGLEKGPAVLAAFAPVLAQRQGSAQPPPLPTGGETIQYQVPLELLVLARNREKDKARSVAVTPVAPRPRADEPPPSSELSGLRTKQAATPPEPDRTDIDSSATGGEQLAGSVPAASTKSGSIAKLALLLAVALCLVAGYCAVELLHLY
jgi:hypothetical protein